MTERKPPGMSFETWVDSQVTRAQARGDFDDLPGAGKPLPRRSGDESTYEWVLSWARKENVDVLGMLPPALALRKEREDLPRRAATLPTEAAVRALVEDFNERVQQFWRRPQEGPAVAVGLADADDVVAAWRAAAPPPAPVVPAPPAPVVPAPPSPAAPTRRRWLPWWRRPEARGRTTPQS
jgi:hypothetical protein